MSFLPKLLLIIAGIIFASGIIWAIYQLVSLNRDLSKKSAVHQESQETVDKEKKQSVDQTGQTPTQPKSEADTSKIDSKSEAISQKRIIKKVVTITTEQVKRPAPASSLIHQTLAEARAGNAWAQAGIDSFGQAYASAYAGTSY